MVFLATSALVIPKTPQIAMLIMFLSLWTIGLFSYKFPIQNIIEWNCWYTIFSSSSFLSIWPRDHLAWPIGFVSLSKAEISFVKVLLRSNSDKSSWVKFNSYEQQHQPNPKLLGPLCGKLQYISESKGPPSPISFDLNPLEGDWSTI